MSPEPRIETASIPEDLRPIILALAEVASGLSGTIALGPLAGDLGASVGSNVGGDAQKALDVAADEAFAAALGAAGVRWYASEERACVLELDPEGRFALAIDPLDGSSNIDANVSIGTIFAIQPALDGGEATFLRPGRHLLAAGYFIYGPQTSLVVTFGEGVLLYVLDRDKGLFRRAGLAPPIAPRTNEFAINASNYRHWAKPIRTYVDDCLAGADGPRGENYNMRWVASLVAEAHRILWRGGIFLYPGDDRRGYEQGRLRLVYEAAPIAFVVEQAGGMATTGIAPILDEVPSALHVRTPLVFGSPEKVRRVMRYHALPDPEDSALFSNRGLFRV